MYTNCISLRGVRDLLGGDVKRSRRLRRAVAENNGDGWLDVHKLLAVAGIENRCTGGAIVGPLCENP